MADFATRLRELRKKRGLRQKDLAATLGLAQTTIANYEQKLRFPDEKTLGMIADFFGASLDFLLGRADVDAEARQGPGLPEPPLPLTGLARRYFDLLRSGDLEAAFRAANGALSNGTSVTELYQDVFGASLREIGRLWAAGEVQVAEEHHFSEATQLFISRLHPAIESAARPKRNLRCVVFAVYGESHVIGARMVSDLLEMEGWDVYHLGGNLSIRHAMRALLDRPPHLLALSVSLAEHLGAAEDLIASARVEKALRAMKVMVGGRAIRAGLWRELGADGASADAAHAAAEAERILREGRTDGTAGPGAASKE
jgi:MerR family transcriptional regulator, light-induced transcriptional regulator